MATIPSWLEAYMKESAEERKYAMQALEAAAEDRKQATEAVTGKAELGRGRERESRSPPPRREAQGRNEFYEGNAFENRQRKNRKAEAETRQGKQNENETRKEQAKNGDRNAQENRDGEQKRGKTKIAEHTPTRNRTEADEDENRRQS
ncbi:hypothetical protein DFP73DRAFT_601245 [Morchella snyderi]|nr:hypothetical protein DFP73DRAFT_601245 [Morchella snyderi]